MAVSAYKRKCRDERDEPDRRAAGDAKGLLAHPALHGTALSDLLHRPGECRLRRADNAPRFGSQPGCFRPGCWDRVLSRLFPARSAEQRGPSQDRCAPLDRAHHDQLGADFGRHGICRRRMELLPRPLSARPGRGGFFPGHDPVLHLLVPADPPGADHGGLHDGDPNLDRARRPDFDEPPRTARHARSCRLAMAVSARSNPGGSARHRLSDIPDRPAGKRQMARARRAGMANRGNAPGAPRGRVGAFLYIVAIASTIRG